MSRSCGRIDCAFLQKSILEGRSLRSIFIIMMRQVRVFCGLLMLFSFSCHSHQEDKDRYAVEYFFKLDTVVPSPDYQYTYYRNRKDPSVLMEDAFSDTTKKKKVKRNFLIGGLHTGPCTFYTEDGAVLTTGYYFEDKKDGEWVTYYLGTTKVRVEQHYIKGLRSGVWKSFDENGKLTIEETYDAAGNRIRKEKDE
jgi:antitoxin component YwqK of YwqJK toxin-antitoxin module